MPPFIIPLISIVAGLLKAPGSAAAKIADVVKAPKRQPTVVETVVGYLIMAGIAAGASKIGASAEGLQAAICSAPAPVSMPSELQDEL